MSDDPLSAKAETAVNAAIAFLGTKEGFTKAWSASDNDTILDIRGKFYITAIRELLNAESEPDGASRLALAIVDDLANRRIFREEVLDSLFVDDAEMAAFVSDHKLSPDLISEDDSREGLCRQIAHAIRTAISAT